MTDTAYSTKAVRKGFALLALHRATFPVALVDEAIVVRPEDVTGLTVHEPISPLALAWIALLALRAVGIALDVFSHQQHAKTLQPLRPGSMA